MSDGAPLVGVDLGGTLVRAAAATGEATHGTPARHPTPENATPGAVLDTVAAAVREASGGVTPAGVAIGIPGPLDPVAGVVYAAPNLDGWKDLPVQRLLEERLGCPVAIQNDANLAGFAEWIAGAARGSRDMIFITVSTGVGGGLVLDGELYSGFAGTAGEAGHMIYDPDGPPCAQGHRGCLEGTASGTAIASRALQLLAAGEASSLSQLDPDRLDAHAVADAAEAGDALAIRLYTESGRALGLAVGGLLNLLSPEVVVIGGGLINAGELLLAPLRAAVGELAFAAPLARCRIVPAALGTDAGLVGAVAWAVRRFRAPAGAAAGA
ncbi:MAG TPA: ROK family protein [Candidatus Dormibacteraeota bacterium]|nr:ROK family protein [Candidatus Dormibacteraeota bacterium]